MTIQPRHLALAGLWLLSLGLSLIEPGLSLLAPDYWAGITMGVFLVIFAR